MRSLSEHGFPFRRGRCVVHLKPSSEINDQAFKADAANDIRSCRGEVAATFESEPGNAHLFLRAYPGASHVLLATIHSPRAEGPSDLLVRTGDFVLP